MGFPRRRFLKNTSADQPISFATRLWRLCIKGGCLLIYVAASLATACLFTLAYPKYSYAWLMWIALAPFVAVLIKLRGFWSSFWYSWFTGLCVYAGIYYWIFVTCYQGGGLSWGLATAAWLGLSALMAVQFALFGGSCYFLKRLGGLFPLTAAMGWVAWEGIHELLATYVIGFPWFSLAYSQWNIPQMLQIVPALGTTSLSFSIALVGISVGTIFYFRSFRTLFGTAVLVGLIVGGTYGYGHWYLLRQSPHSLLRLRAAVMQPNIDQYKKWDPQFEAEIQQVLADMSQQVSDKQVLLTVWPESVTPGEVQTEPYRSWIENMAQEQGSWQLLGSNRQDAGHQYVSAFLFSPQGNVEGVYDKEHLVPFGEFIPLENLLRRLFPQVEVLGELGGFTPGKKEQSLFRLNQILIGRTICYETFFSHLWREQVKNGARILVNLTNDAWFFDTAAPYQHLAAAVLRAVQARRPLLRAANTGISAIIAPTGEILLQADLNTRDILIADIPLSLEPDVTFWVWWGDWLMCLWAVLYFTILISIITFVDD